LARLLLPDGPIAVGAGELGGRISRVLLIVNGVAGYAGLAGASGWRRVPAAVSRAGYQGVPVIGKPTLLKGSRESSRGIWY
jgi:hypothetical protein